MSDMWSTYPIGKFRTHCAHDSSQSHRSIEDNALDFPNMDGLMSEYQYTTTSSPLQLSSPLSDLASPVESAFNPNQPRDTMPSPTISPTALYYQSPSPNLPGLSSSSSSSYSPSLPGTPSHHSTSQAKRTEREDKRHALDARRGSKPNGRRTHNLIEKNYRTNLNKRMMTLRDHIPSLCSTTENEDGDPLKFGHPKLLPIKVNKGVILEKAIEYIAELERQKESQELELSRLRSMTDDRIKRCMYPNGLRRRDMAKGY